MADRISEAPIREAINDKETGLISRIWAAWFRDLFRRVTAYLDSTFTAAGYGGIGLNGVEAIGTINDTFQTLIGWDTELVDIPKDVVQNTAGSGLELNKFGVWQFSVKVSIEFDELNAGRKIIIRSYNATKGTGGTAEFVFFIGRNQGGINLPITISVDVNGSDSDIGDLLQLQIRKEATSAQFTNANNIGSIFQANHISEPSRANA